MTLDLHQIISSNFAESLPSSSEFHRDMILWNQENSRLSIFSRINQFSRVFDFAEIPQMMLKFRLKIPENLPEKVYQKLMN